eukprot:EG_transcript_24521
MKYLWADLFSGEEKTFCIIFLACRCFSGIFPICHRREFFNWGEIVFVFAIHVFEFQLCEPENAKPCESSTIYSKKTTPTIYCARQKWLCICGVQVDAYLVHFREACKRPIKGSPFKF